MVRHRKLDYQFLSVIFQLRMVQLLALPLAMLTLAMEVEKITSAAFLFPLLFMIFNFYIVFSRCYESVDGRFDYRAMLSAPELSSKIEYFCDLFLPSIFALVTHFVAPELQSSFTSMVFRLSDYFVLDCAIATAVVECVEGQRLSYL
ncbi:hypothetical protein M3Y94_00817400 [Aphelenchoides besseyi]|nr:hypothetical protein M3Y94_00817400 [Aphelenchoides besseyi]